MAHIKVKFVNQLNCQLICDNDVMYEMAEELSFFVPGYKFTPKYKAGVWDGKIRLVNMRTGYVYKNLLPRVAKWAKSEGHTIELLEKEKFRPVVKWDPAWLDRWEDYGRMKPHKHQTDYIDAVMAQNQGLVLAPTSSGKSYIIYMCVRYFLENSEGDILITVPSTGLVEQLYSDFEDYAQGKDWVVGDHVAKLYGGQSKDTTRRRVVISTWQSIYKDPAQHFSRYQAYFCDEAHGADAKSLSGIIDKLPHCAMRVGLTGTLDGTVVHELELVGRFGFIIKKVTTRQLMDLGLVANLHIICHRIQYSKEECEAVLAAKKYDKEIDYVISHERRNELIADTAMACKGNSLILFNFIEKQGVALKKMLEDRAEAAGKVVFYIAGNVKTAERERLRKLMETRSDVVLLATYGVLSTGISIKNLEHILFAHPYKARIKNLQSIGRGLRLREGKNEAWLHDFGDDFSLKKRTKEKVNFLMTHFIARLETYQSEEFDYEIRKVDFSSPLL